MSGPWYVDATGNVFEFRVHSPNTIRLSDGRVLDPDKEDCGMFATEEAAKKYAEEVISGNSDQGSSGP